jgi:pSer/pThr/pTyr-binding forkhead associated (FHA) protein
VGRFNEADLVVGDDVMVSNTHFAVEHDGQTCRLRDLNSRFGTLLNRAKVAETVLRDGDQIVAGQTTFGVRLWEETLAQSPGSPGSPVAPQPARAAKKPQLGSRAVKL